MRKQIGSDVISQLGRKVLLAIEGLDIIAHTSKDGKSRTLAFKTLRLMRGKH